MACVLHFFGADAHVDELLRLAPAPTCAVYRKGKPSSDRPAARLAATSGVSMVASDTDFDDLDEQQAQALTFLRQHHLALAAMRDVPGLEVASIDFGISMRNVVMQSDTFDADLLVEIARLRMRMVLSQYPTARKTRKLKQYRRSLRGAI